MTERTFRSMAEARAFCLERKSDRKAHYWFGFWESFNSNLDTIEDFEKALDESWFEDGATASITELDDEEVASLGRISLIAD